MKKIQAVALALAVLAGVLVLAATSAAQDPPADDGTSMTTCVSDPDCSAENPTTTVIECDPVPNDPSCPNYESHWHSTETSVFVCSPYPDPSCFDEPEEAPVTTITEPPVEAGPTSDPVPYVPPTAPRRLTLPETS